MMKQDKKNFCLSVAGHSFAIHAIYSQVYDLCRDYLTDEHAEEEIFITEEDINAEQNEFNEQDTIIRRYPYLETLAVYRKIAEKILDYDIFLMHGAVLGYQDSAYMFTAASGTGKTTHIMKWLDNLDEAYVVNGDKPLIKITDNEAIACGTPWQGKEKLGQNCMIPLKAIVFMERGENNFIEEVSFEKVLALLIRQTYMPEDAAKLKKTLGLVSKLKGRVRFYKFVFNNMKSDAFEVAYKGIVL